MPLLRAPVQVLRHPTVRGGSDAVTGRTRQRMVSSAAVLLRRHGVRGTSFARVLEDSGAPRGSVAHHFPGGKEEMVLAAVSSAGAEITARLRALAEDGATAGDVVAALCDYFAAGLEQTGYRAGCPVAAVAQEAFDTEPLRDAAAAVLDDWLSTMTQVLAREGREDSDAQDLAATCVAAVEGAIMMSRVQRDRAPLDAVARRLRILVTPDP
ncbi:TetR family transcriptional regulator C-terminal domain-containing protein [Pseudonocardia sp. NPDC046786]|uniref:TetR/AcrR family transcriptional regulator n=1 Tax=Pseudonocardia sp. NPDC046786 TaxID=3155471 RepID=UPI0033E04F13